MYLGDEAGPTRKPGPEETFRYPEAVEGRGPLHFKAAGLPLSKWILSPVRTATQACYEIENDNQAGGNIQRWR